MTEPNTSPTGTIQKPEAKRYPLEDVIETRGFRPEIQGLRAFAVLLVVLYHVWFGRVSGGVDVFLFISAFLLSLSYLRKINEGKDLNLFGYWLHVFQRLLPVATVTIAGTTIASFFILAPSRWTAIMADAKASLFYYLNWHLANNSVDYYAQNAAAKTPFQHFWSLSIQGQIFILWPLLFALAAYLVRRYNWNLFTAAVLIFNTIFVASLTFSIIETEQNQGYAYFDTRTRLWEFAIGTLLAMLALKWKAPEKARVIMGWVGIIGLVICGAVLPVQRSFPGFLALWPVLSGALVIMAGRTNSKWGIDRLLVSAPLQNLGNISYALYLVHWPILILYSAAVGKTRVDFLEGAVIIVVSIAIAWLLTRFIEKPLRYRKDPFVPWLMMKMRFKKIFAVETWADQLAFLLAIFLVAGLPLAGAQAWVARTNAQAVAQSEQKTDNPGETDSYPGARAIGTDRMHLVDNPIPNGDVTTQYESLNTQNCEGAFKPSQESLEKYCSYEQHGGDDAPLIMFVGNSHIEQSMASFKPIAEQTKSNLQSFMLGGCMFPREEVSASNECSDFNRDVVEEILQRKPQTVVITATAADARTNEERIDPKLEETVKELTDAGIQVIGLRDNPRYDYNVYECVQKAGDDKSSCARPLKEKLAEQNPAQKIFDHYDGAIMVDLIDLYCPEDTCEAVIGNVYVYLDDNHVTKSYARTMAQAVYDRAVRGGWFVNGRLKL